MWEREAEDNVLERLQKTGVMAPESEVDRVMQTVVNNLIFTNNLNIQPEVRTRVLLTTPLESFTIGHTIGHTIVLSRGLLDVLPDEASLAMILAHELGHLALGHRLDTKFAFNDRMFFADESTFSRFDFTRDPAEERTADRKAMELLANSTLQRQVVRCGFVPAGFATRSAGAQESDPAPPGHPVSEWKCDPHVSFGQLISRPGTQSDESNRRFALGSADQARSLELPRGAGKRKARNPDHISRENAV